MTKGNVASIETSGFVDGPGIRVVVFLQGCPLRCLYCHNPDIAFFNDKKNLMTPKQVVDRILRYKSYFGKEGGVTFSGGEPLNQLDFLYEVLKLCKENGITTAIDTSGVCEKAEKVLKYVDTVILDIKAVDEDEYKALTGREISTFKQFLLTCQKLKKDLWLRQVIVPGINDDKEHIDKLKDFITDITNVKKIELLPYHDMAKQKYKNLGLEYRLESTPPMDRKRCLELQGYLLSQDKPFPCQVKEKNKEGRATRKGC